MSNYNIEELIRECEQDVNQMPKRIIIKIKSKQLDNPILKEQVIREMNDSKKEDTIDEKKIINGKDEEIWKFIPGTFDKYKISNTGKVLSLHCNKLLIPYLEKNKNCKFIKARLPDKVSKTISITRLLYDLFGVRNTDINHDNEIWKYIPDTDEQYEVSNYGRIYSIHSNRILEPRIDDNRKLFTTITDKNNEKVCYPIHRLVYIIFNQELNKNQTVQHLDNDINNNHIDNLVSIIMNNKSYQKSNLQSNEGEMWKDIKGFEGRYKISNHGRVFSIIHNEHMKAVVKTDGYERLSLTNENNKRISLYIHRLVADNFIKSINNECVVDHINNIPNDNKLSNLRIISRSDNSKNLKKYKDNILQFDNTGKKLIKEYSDINDVINQNNEFNKDTLFKCLNRVKVELHLLTAYNYVWKYKNKYIKDLIKPTMNKKINLLKKLFDNKNFKNIGKFDKYDLSEYEINEYGIVRKINDKRILKSQLIDGYFNISLKDNNSNKRFNFRINRLVCTAFHGYKNGYVVNHKNEIKTDNHYNNLEWLTPKDNTIYSMGKKVKQINADTNEVIKTYPTIKKARESFDKGCNNKISDACNTGKIYKGFKWEWA